MTIKGEKRAAGKLPRVRQVAYIVTRPQKADALGRVLEFEDPASAIVFCRTRVEVDELTDTLKSHGYGAQALHGGMEQKQRDRVMQLFRQEKADVLVATDVAARGLDIDHVSHVINYDIPTSPEVYVHRIGRTGRIGREGVAITLVDPREQRVLRAIEGLTKQPIEIVALPTAAALRARRLDITRAALKERLVAGGLDDMRAVVESLAHDFDLMDIAAAAVAMMHEEAEAANASAPAAGRAGARRGGRQRADDGVCTSAPAARRASGPAISSAPSPAKPRSPTARSAASASVETTRSWKYRRRSPIASSRRCAAQTSAAGKSTSSAPSGELRGRFRRIISDAMEDPS